MCMGHGLNAPLKVTVESRHRRNLPEAMHECPHYRDHRPAVERVAIALADVAQYGIFENRFSGARFLEKYEHRLFSENAGASILGWPAHVCYTGAGRAKCRARRVHDSAKPSPA
jgi:hypothetical protein